MGTKGTVKLGKGQSAVGGKRSAIQGKLPTGTVGLGKRIVRGSLLPTAHASSLFVACRARTMPAQSDGKTMQMHAVETCGSGLN
jgi:hypothetical protein